MPEHLVTVATFLSSVEANLARNRLEEAGIPAFLAGEEMIGMSWMLGNAVGGIRLQVAEEHAAAAVQKLADLDDEQDTLDGDDLPRSDSADESITTKPVRRVPGALEQAVTDTPEPAEAADVDEADAGAPDEHEEEFVSPPLGEELAARAFKAAVIGIFILPPLVNLYSLYVLHELGGWQGELSRTGSRKAVAAMAINALMLALAFIGFFGLLFVRRYYLP